MKNSGMWLAGLLAVCALSVSCRAQEAWSHGDGFPIMTWELAPKWSPMFSDAHHGLESLKECGFTVAGFVRPEQLKECERLGLKAIVCEARGQMELKDRTDDEIDQMVKKLVDEGGNSPTVIGYFLRDEPGAKEFAELGKAVAAVKKYAPGKLAYINLLPDYAIIGAKNPKSQLGTDTYTEYLERFVQEVKPQLISYDNYRVLFSGDLKDPKLYASYYKNLLEVRRVAMEHNLPFWNIATCNEIRPHRPVPSPANFLFHAYTTLAAGGQGMTWFKYYQGGYHYAPIDTSGNRTITWSFLRMTNDQLKVLGPMMKKLKSQGVYFTSPAPVDALPLLPGKLVQEVTSPTPVMVGEFEGSDGASYAMVVNLSLEASTKFAIKCHESKDGIRAISPVDGRLAPMESDHAMWLTAGQGVLLKL